MGLAYLAGVLERHDVRVTILDSVVTKMDLEQTVNRVLSSECDILGVTATTPTISSASQVLKQVNRERSEVTTVVGGTHISARAMSILVFFIVERGKLLLQCLFHSQSGVKYQFECVPHLSRFESFTVTSILGRIIT